MTYIEIAVTCKIRCKLSTDEAKRNIKFWLTLYVTKSRVVWPRCGGAIRDWLKHLQNLTKKCCWLTLWYFWCLSFHNLQTSVTNLVAAQNDLLPHSCISREAFLNSILWRWVTTCPCRSSSWTHHLRRAYGMRWSIWDTRPGCWRPNPSRSAPRARRCCTRSCWWGRLCSLERLFPSQELLLSTGRRIAGTRSSIWVSRVQSIRNAARRHESACCWYG